MRKSNLLLLSVLLSLIYITQTGCLTYKQMVNFQDGESLKSGTIDSITNYTPFTVQPNDVLMINVSSFNSEEASRFNIIEGRFQARAGSGGVGATDPFGYRVDYDGNIEMPVLGKVYVKDLTVEQVRDTVSSQIAALNYLKEHSVQVQFLTFRVTILGEVGKPGTYTINNTKISILEAVGLASDLTMFSNRDNLLVIREKDGIRTYGRVDLKTKAVFNSPYYYLMPNDIVYVEPHKSKILAAPDPLSRYLGTIISLATFIILLTEVL